MDTPDRQLVFVPLIGSNSVSDWTTVPHRKAWGLLADNALDILLCLRSNGRPSEDYQAAGDIMIFDAELALVTPITDDDPDVPDAVYTELARRALVREAN